MPRKISPDGKISVLIPGIGAGSLGLEIAKALRHARGYRLIGTDIAETAYGLYDKECFDHTYLIRRLPPQQYAEQLLEIALRDEVDAVAPGAEEVHRILAENREIFERRGILVMLNTRKVIGMCGDKSTVFAFLRQRDITVPDTRNIVSDEDVEGFASYPCVVKPDSMSGGSNLVFIAENPQEAVFLVRYLRKRGYNSTLQQYITCLREFTAGVLSAPTGEVLGSVAMERLLDNKLSYKLRYGGRVISSGWSQGRIDNFPEVRAQAERIATALNSKWAMNIQGRLNEDGVFLPFDINPRHSGTTYLRALAGFNEPHLLLQHFFNHTHPPVDALRPGHYLRGFEEKFVSDKDMKTHG